MPCNIGYRSVTEAVVKAPSPTVLQTRTSAPQVDAELLDQLGVQDPVFLAWMTDLDPSPLLDVALQRMLAAMGTASGIDMSIQNGQLLARAVVSAGDQATAERAMAERGRRFQLEVLRLVAELLDYEMSEQSAGNSSGSWVLEGDKQEPSQIRRFLRITFNISGQAEIRIEHAASESDLQAEEARVIALARRLGIPITRSRRSSAGQPIAPGTVHKHKNRGGSK